MKTKITEYWLIFRAMVYSFLNPIKSKTIEDDLNHFASLPKNKTFIACLAQDDLKWQKGMKVYVKYKVFWFITITQNAELPPLSEDNKDNYIEICQELLKDLYYIFANDVVTAVVDVKGDQAYYWDKKLLTFKP